MQISKIYSNSQAFKNIRFNLDGINVIYGDISKAPKSADNSHCLGKSKVAEVIDFLLLKGINKEHFFLRIKNGDQSAFIDHVFYLEIRLNDGQYLTICRSIQKPTKISFAISPERESGFAPPSEWVKENMPLAKAKVFLQEQLKMNFFKSKAYDYRKAINYSLRLQDDFKDVYKLKKFQVGKDVDWKPFMFDLLGFPGNLLLQKYSAEEELDRIKDQVSTFEREYSVKSDKRDELIAQRDVVAQETKKIENEIDVLDFTEAEKSLIDEGVNDLEQRISFLNSECYRLKQEIQRLEKVANSEFAFDLRAMFRLYEESHIVFGLGVKKNLNQLLKFNKSLTTERAKLASKQCTQKSKLLEDYLLQLSDLNKKRVDLTGKLSETNTLKRLKNAQIELVKYSSHALKFSEQISAIDKIIGLESSAEEYKNNVRQCVASIKDLHHKTEENPIYHRVRMKFSKIYKNIMNENAYISWKINDSGNVDFVSPKIKSKQQPEIDSAKDEGNTYMKLLCVAFDLAILVSKREESYYRFVFHDDVFSQEDNRVKLRLLSEIHRICSESKIQYILTAIRADLPINKDDSPMYFLDSEIVLKLNDADEKGTLFGFEF